MPISAGRASSAGAAIAAAFLLAALAWRANLERACVVLDTPYIDMCSASPQDVPTLKSRIAGNPGDTNAYVRLAVSSGADAGASLLAAAAQLAPAEPNIMMARAITALRANDIDSATQPLVQLVEYRDVPAARAIVAQMIAAGESARLIPYVTTGSTWLNRVLGEMPRNPASVSAALPLVVKALTAGVLDYDAARLYLRRLKAAGLWSDAYALWLAIQGGALPPLFNPGFDNPFKPDGFDWEILQSGPPSRAGAIVERKGSEGRSSVLEVRFTGRTFATPLVRQYVFLAPGTYRLRGEFESRQLRMENGLAWAVRCTSRETAAGKSSALRDTQGQWLPFSFEFTIPPDCGLVASLQLETYTPVEASLGARGRAAFDAFTLEKVRSP